MQDSYEQNTDVSFLVKKLDNHIQRAIHTLYDRRQFQECSLMNMWVADYVYHMQLQDTPVFQKDVEAEFSINRATASKMLSLMEQKKLIYRVSSRADSRLKQICLEPRGLELQQLCQQIRGQIEARLTGCMTPDEQKLFKALLARMIARM